jgi:predicted RNase H-like HicB family nuclease
MIGFLLCRLKRRTLRRLVESDASRPATGEASFLKMKFTVTIDRDEDGVWVAECPAIPGCASQGQTKEDALGNIKEAIVLCLEVRSEQGLPLTIETRLVEVAM